VRAPADGLRLHGVRLDDVGPMGAMRAMERALDGRRPLHIATINMGFLTLASRDPAFAEAIERADLSVVDGRLLLWCRRLAGPGAAGQLTGHDLARIGARMAARRGRGVLLLGGGPGVAAAAARRLVEDVPDLRVVGVDGGRFSRDGRTPEQRSIERILERFRPGLVLVGLGAPKQELWLARNLRRLPPAIGIGVGGVLDTLAGRLARAPRPLQRMGLESLFQLCIRPRRFGRRYLIEDPPTLLRTLFEAVRRRTPAWSEPTETGWGVHTEAPAGQGGGTTSRDEVSLRRIEGRPRSCRSRDPHGSR